MNFQIILWSMDYNRCYVSGHENNINFIILHIFIRAFGWQVKSSINNNTFKGDSSSQEWLRIFSTPCCKPMCCHSSFIFPFIEYNESIFSIFPKGLQFSSVSQSYPILCYPIDCSMQHSSSLGLIIPYF